MVVENVVFKFKNYKCFKDEYAGFDKIMPINVIIGKNNSGKSSLTDILHSFFGDPEIKEALKDTEFYVEKDVQDEVIKKLFPVKEQISLGGYHNSDAWNSHGQHLLGLRYKFTFHSNLNVKSKDWSDLGAFNKGARGGIVSQEVAIDRKLRLESHLDQTKHFRHNFLLNKILKKISSERDVNSEDLTTFINLKPNGEGATAIIARQINKSDLDRDLIRKTLLDALNQIFVPDSKFNEIVVQQIDGNGTWEIYFDEDDKGLIPLSKSGSGLKTVIQVLLNLLVVPENKSNKLDVSEYIFVFEELENNLHPALLRRLFSYIENFAREKKCIFFITTHSPVVIDKFGSCDIAQIIHVTHDGKTARTKTVNNFSDSKYLLDDIGAKASDLLQANGVVWLEGPSDRIYFNKWLKIISEGKLKEHRDYECAFFGGTVLVHFKANPEEDGDAVNILRINRNAVLITDSDKTSSKGPKKQRVERIVNEMDEIGAFSWVTGTKEIENYIPKEALEKIYKKDNLPQVEQFQYFYSKSLNQDTYWKSNIKKTFNKVDLARDVIEHLDKENMENRFDWKENMEKIAKIIEGWNKDR